MTLLFAVGMLGLRVRDSRLSHVAAGCALLAAAAALASLAYQAAGHAPEDADAPVGVDVAYAAATFGILVALLLFGVAFRRARALRGTWSSVPLVCAIVWFPLEGLAAVLPDGWGLLAGGVAWLAVVVVIARRAIEPQAA